MTQYRPVLTTQRQTPFWRVPFVVLTCCVWLMTTSSRWTLAEEPGTTPLAPPTPATSLISQIRVIGDQTYQANSGQAGLCDVYLPQTTPPQGHPVVLVVHGGAWASGDKWTLAGYAYELSKHGFAAVTINYRLAPQHKFPKQVDDVRQALIWTNENADRFSFDMNRLAMFGYSAGGHLVTLVAALADEPIETQIKTSLWPESDSRWRRLPTIRAVCAGGPPCDFQEIPLTNTSLAYFLGGSRGDNPEVYRVASPIAHASAADPVMQFIHGENDMLVPVDDSRRMHEIHRTLGIESRLKILPNQGHMITFLNPETSRTTVAFFREVLNNPQEPIRKGG